MQPSYILHVSNWLRYVPPAAPGAATLRLKQMGRELYAVSPRALAPRAPLTLAWEPNRLSVSTEKTPGEEEGAVEDDWCCYECGEQLDSAASLELHLETHEPPPALVRRRKGARGKCRRLKSVPKCPKCHQVFSRTFCLNRHMLSCAKQTPISKQILELNQPTEVNSVAPKKREVSPRINGSNVPCDSLDEPSSAINAQQNKATENGATHYVECALCDERHSNLCKYREHTETHRQPDGTFHCTYCAKRYPLYTRVRKHVRTYHAPRTRLPCPHGCPLSFPYQALLTTHLLTHSLVKQFECECGKAFKRKSKLLQHVREKHPTDGPTDTHGGERIGACLMKNVKKHAFVCQLCQLSFRRRSMLVEHINSRHPDCSPSSALELARGPLWDYRCTRCPRVYRSAAQRKKHFLHLHSGEDPPADDECVRERDLLAVPTHRCPVPGCVKQYASNGKLLRHIRQKHIQNTQVRGESADASTNQEVETEAPPPPPPPSLHLPTPLLPPVEFDDCAAATAILFLAADEHTAFMYQQGQAMQAVTLELEEAGMGGDETLPGAAVGYLTVRPPPGSEVEFMDTPTLSHSEGGYLTAPPPKDSEGGYLTVPPPPDPEGGYLTAPPPPDSEGGYLTAPPPPDSEGGYLMAPPPPDSEERYLAAPPPPYYYQHNYMDNSDVPDM